MIDCDGYDVDDRFIFDLINNISIYYFNEISYGPIQTMDTIMFIIMMTIAMQSNIIIIMDRNTIWTAVIMNGYDVYMYGVEGDYV